jgi:hypothetical protein
MSGRQASALAPDQKPPPKLRALSAGLLFCSIVFCRPGAKAVDNERAPANKPPLLR